MACPFRKFFFVALNCFNCQILLNWWKDMSLSCLMYSFNIVLILPQMNFWTLRLVSFPFFVIISLAFHCSHFTRDVLFKSFEFFAARICWYFSTPQSLHLPRTHSFLGNSSLRVYSSSPSPHSLLSEDLKGHDVISTDAEWFFGIPWNPSPIQVSLRRPRFWNYSHLHPRKCVTVTVRTERGFREANVLHPIFLWPSDLGM